MEFRGLNLHTLPHWAALFWDVIEVKSADIPFEEDIKLVPKLSTSWIGLSDVLLVTTWAQLLGYQPFGDDKIDPADG